MKLNGTDGNWSGAPVPGAVGISNRHNEDSNYPESKTEDSDEENYYADPCDPKNPKEFKSVAEVDAAIEACKKAIYESTECTDERKDLVDQMIKLKICHQDLVDREENPIEGFETKGHVFVDYHNEAGTPIPGVSSTRRVYCQVCCYSIWIYIQGSKHCSECGYSVHLACVEGIKRECVAMKVKTQPDFIMAICPEVSLYALDYKCVECGRQFRVKNPRVEYRLCDYTGLSYCATCHWRARSVTPARIVKNWQFEPREVCQASAQYLFLMRDKPIIRPKDHNPKLFAVEQELNHVQVMRNKIMLMKKYLTVCRLASEQKILLHLASRQHFVESADYYSIQDLVDVKSGVMGEFITKVVDTFAIHIKTCILCLAKGFICEICDGRDPNGADVEDDAKSVIFPFDEVSAICPDCQGVFHKMCFKISSSGPDGSEEIPDSNCPKCARIKSREEQLSGSEVNTSDEAGALAAEDEDTKKLDDSVDQLPDSDPGANENEANKCDEDSKTVEDIYS